MQWVWASQHQSDIPVSITTVVAHRRRRLSTPNTKQSIHFRVKHFSHFPVHTYHSFTPIATCDICTRRAVYSYVMHRCMRCINLNQNQLRPQFCGAHKKAVEYINGTKRNEMKWIIYLYVCDVPEGIVYVQCSFMYCYRDVMQRVQLIRSSVAPWWL